MRIINIRAIPGPNVHHHKPVMIMSLQLGSLDGLTSADVPEFNSRLLGLLPGLREHHCSVGKPGGFVERLYEGTYFGHVTEHVALDLASQLGSRATHGKTRSAGKPGLYDVIVRYHNEAVMRYLLPVAVDLVTALADGRDFDIERPLAEGRSILEATELGPSTRAIVEAAGRRSIPWRRLNRHSLVQFGYGRNLKRIQAAATGDTSFVAVDIACNKELTKELLEAAFLPVPRGGTATTVEEALRLQTELAGPVAVKPLDGNQGRGVSLEVSTGAEMRQAFAKAVAISSRVVVEQFLEGRDYRILVVGGRMVAASWRRPCSVTGDGSSTIAELIEQANRDPRRGEGHSRALTLISAADVDPGISLTRVPTAGETVELQRTANLSQGGTAVDVTDRVHPATRLVAERAARIIGLDICGVDIVTKDISEPLTGGIVEVNAAPGLRMHLHPEDGDPRDVGGAIMDMLYPAGADGRIPITAITGTNGKTTVTRLLGHILGSSGLTVGMTTTGGIRIGGNEIAQGDLTGPASARAVLSSPEVDAAVLECARGGIVRNGLGYDWSDVGVVTNIRPDHLGQDDIEDLDDLVWIKSLVAERVREGGKLVLNADDPESAGLANSERVTRLNRTVVFFSLDADHPVVAAHLATGGTAFVLREGWLGLAQGSVVELFARAADLPVTMGGAARHQISNCLAAAAAAHAQGISLSVIAHALESFSGSSDNPGRANLWRYGKGLVLLDYGHNPDAFRATAELAASWNRPLACVASVPGDRSDGLIQEAARVLAEGFDKLWLKEDSDLRGRARGEVAGMMLDEARRHVPGTDCRVVLDEMEAVAEALAAARDGATAVLFIEKIESVQAQLRSTGGTPATSGGVAMDSPRPFPHLARLQGLN